VYQRQKRTSQWQLGFSAFVGAFRAAQPVPTISVCYDRYSGIAKRLGRQEWKKYREKMRQPDRAGGAMKTLHWI
jgi:hypothetical protein